MRTGRLGILGLLAAFVALTGESCILEEKEVEVPVRSEEEARIHITARAVPGFQTEGTEVIDFSGALRRLEEDNAFDELVALRIESCLWRVDQNDGDPNLTVTGGVTVRWLGAPAPLPGEPVESWTDTLISYRSLAISSLSGDYEAAPLEPEGVDVVSRAFARYLEIRERQRDGENLPLPTMDFRFDWTGSASSGNIDFYCGAKVKFTLVGIIRVDVPEVF